MNSFSATFRFQEQAHTVIACVHEVHQDGDSKGHPTSKTYSDELLLSLEMTNDVLPLILWARDKKKSLPGEVIFHSADGLTPSVCLSFEDGFCVSYEEHFAANNAGQQAFYCQISIVARSFTLGNVTFDNRWPVRVP